MGPLPTPLQTPGLTPRATPRPSPRATPRGTPTPSRRSQGHDFRSPSRSSMTEETDALMAPYRKKFIQAPEIFSSFSSKEIEEGDVLELKCFISCAPQTVSLGERQHPSGLLSWSQFIREDWSKDTHDTVSKIRRCWCLPTYNLK